MIFTGLNSTSFKTSSNSDFGDVVGDAIKKMTYHNGDTDFVDFGARQTATGDFDVVQLSFTDYNTLNTYFSDNVGTEIGITIEPGEFPFGPLVTGSITASLVEYVPEGEQAFSENGNFSFGLKMSYVDNPVGQPDFDFLVECELSAWSVDEIIPSLGAEPTGVPVGYTIFWSEPGLIYPFAVHIGGDVWNPYFSKKRYETTYWDDARVGSPTFDGANTNDDAYSGGDRSYWVWDGSTWNSTPFPSIDPFKPVILNGSIPGLHNSKFYWSSFTDLAIDNSDPFDLLPPNYESGVIQKKGIKFPKWSVDIQRGPAVEKISGFSFKLQNADRKNILSNQVNFFGSWCVLKVWDKTQNGSVMIRSGLNRTSGFSFADFQFDVEPKTWNDNQKTIPSRSMATLLDVGDLGTQKSEELIPQTFGSWDFAKTRVKFMNVGALEINGRKTHNIIREPTFDAVSQTIDFYVAIDVLAWSQSTTQYIKATGDDECFQIVGWSEFNNNPLYQTGHALIRVNAPQTKLGLFDISKSVAIVENKFQLVIDDKICQGFGDSLNVLTYDTDANEYFPTPPGVFVVVDNQTIALGNDPSSFMIDDNLNLIFGNPILADNQQFVIGTDYRDKSYMGNSNSFLEQSDGVLVKHPDIKFKFDGQPEQTGERAFVNYGGDDFLNIPNDGIWPVPFIELTDIGTTPEWLAYPLALRYLSQSSNTPIWSKATTGNVGVLMQTIIGRCAIDRTNFNLVNNPGRQTDVQNQPHRSDGFYYHQINGGLVSAFRLRWTDYRPTSPKYKLAFNDTKSITINNADKPYLMTQRFPITDEVKNALRGAKSVRLLGSLYYSFMIGHQTRIERGPASADIWTGAFANIRIIGTLKTDNAVDDRIIIDKTFNVSDDATQFNTDGTYRQSSVWGSSRARHVIYNLPDSMGGDTSKYYGDNDEITSTYFRLILERGAGASENGEPTLGETIRNDLDFTIFGTIVGFSGGIVYPRTDTSTNIDWVEVLVQMDATSTGEFQVGDYLTTSSSNFAGTLKESPTPDKWWGGRDLFKLDEFDVADLFTDENFRFGDFQNLDFEIIPFYNSGYRADTNILAEIGFGNPFDNDVTEYQGIFWESSSEMDLSNSDNIFVECQGRTNSDGDLMENPDEIFESQIQQIDSSAELVSHPSANYSSWKSRDQLVGEHSLGSLMSEFTKHIFGMVTFGDSGEYVVRSLDYLDHPIQPTDFKVDFDETNVVWGSVGDVKYRDVDEIHTEFEFNFDFSPGKGETNRKVSLSWDDVTNSLDISGFGGDDDTPKLQAIKQSLIESLNTQLGEQFRVSRNFYNTGAISKKIVDLPLFYDSDLWVTDDNFPISTLVKSISKWVRFYLFNSWTMKFQTKMDVVITNGLRLGDLVTFQFDAITGTEKLFAFVRGMKPKFYDGLVELEIFASVDPWVYSTFYDRIWDAGIVTDSYSSDDFKHTEFFKYPFKDTNQNGTFSDNGDLNSPTYDPADYQFTDNSVADPDEPFNPIP